MSPTHRLIILRHAKSSWSTGVLDHKRPLNERGLRDGVADSVHRARTPRPTSPALDARPARGADSRSAGRARSAAPQGSCIRQVGATCRLWNPLTLSRDIDKPGPARLTYDERRAPSVRPGDGDAWCRRQTPRPLRVRKQHAIGLEPSIRDAPTGGAPASPAPKPRPVGAAQALRAFGPTDPRAMERSSTLSAPTACR